MLEMGKNAFFFADMARVTFSNELVMLLLSVRVGDQLVISLLEVAKDALWKCCCHQKCCECTK